MINTLEGYISQSMPRWGNFSTNPSLRKKVDERGNILPFEGNTVVFLLEEETKQRLAALRASLYTAAPEMLASPLQASTFHMTLHDLANGEPGRPGLQEAMEDARRRAAQLMDGWENALPLRMRATWLFNMVNTSIVLGLAPADGQTHRRLEAMYMALESVVELGYGLTPHITMAYFRPGTYSQEQVQRLSAALTPVELEVNLRMEQLVLQEFTDMNHYETLDGPVETGGENGNLPR